MPRWFTGWELWLVVGVLSSCSPARFVDPAKQTPPARPIEYETPVAPEPEIREKVKDRFIWGRPSGELNLALLLHLHERHEKAVIDRLVELARSLEFSNLGKDKSYMADVAQVRFSVFIDKESGFSNTASNWAGYSPATQKASVFRSLVEQSLERARISLKNSRNENFLWSPYASIERVAQSVIPDTLSGPSALKIIYLRDRDANLHGVENSRQSLASTLRLAPWGKVFSSLSLFSFGNPDSKCKPTNSELGIDLRAGFVDIAVESEELCGISLASVQKAFSSYARPQGHIILSRSANPLSIQITVNGRTLNTVGFRYSDLTQEISLSTDEGLRAGDVVEVTYEPAR